MSKRRVVIGEPDWRTAELLKRTLGRSVEASIAPDGFRTLRAAMAHVPDLIILDTALPDPSGTIVCRMLRARERTARVPIVLISAMATADDRIQGLRIGADDYIAKPFNPEELRLRIRALLKRSAPEPTSRIARFEHALLTADFENVAITVDGRPVTLTRREFDLLRYFVERRHRVLPPRTILRDVWYGAELQHGTSTVTLHVGRLRAKLGRAGELIETVVGRGYRFNGDGEATPCRIT